MGLDRERQVQLVEQGEIARHGEHQDGEPPVPQHPPHPDQGGRLPLTTVIAGQHHDLRNGEDAEDTGRHQATDLEVDGEQNRAQDGAQQRPGVAPDLEHGERLGPALGGLQGQVRARGRLEQGPGGTDQQHRGQRHQGILRQAEAQEGDDPQSASGDDRRPRPDPVDQHPAGQEQPLLGEGASPQHQPDRRGRHADVVDQVGGQERHHHEEAQVDSGLVDHQQPGRRAESAHFVKHRRRLPPGRAREAAGGPRAGLG